jgi:hypothetical protein
VASEDSDLVAADIEALKKGGVDLTRIAETANSIYADLAHDCNAFAIEGDDDIAKTLRTKYEPGEKDGLEFLRMLGITIGTDGEKVVDVGKTFDDMNETANSEVSQGGRKA